MISDYIIIIHENVILQFSFLGTELLECSCSLKSYFSLMDYGFFFTTASIRSNACGGP